MLQIIFKPTFISLLLVFSIDLSCTGSDPQDKDRAKNITINMVTHGQASDPFWSVVSNGAKAAAEDLGIRLVYQSPQNFDMVAMSQIIDAVIATDPDGLVLSVPDIPALKRSISSAVKKNIPIIVFYHPAYLLRNPKDKKKVWEDLLYLKSVMKEYYC